jgi:hypothetical protein
MTTRLQELAWLSTKDPARERKVESCTKGAKEGMKPGIELRNFTSKAETMDWPRGK